MKSVRFLVIAAVVAGLLGGCKSVRPAPKKTAEAARATTFPHSRHDGIDCTDCHGDVAKSAKLGEAPLPGAAKCEECHDAKAPDAPGQAIRGLRPRESSTYQFTFNHAEHLARIKDKTPCAKCHEALPEPGPARDWTPPMKSCTSCHHHEEEVSQARCQPCHVSLRRYPLKPIEALAGFSHQGDFVREHRDLAKNSAATCAQCHDQTYCARCHATATEPLRPSIRFPEEVQANFIHRSDFVSRHQIEAAADPASCRKCHGSFFCESCHRELGVASSDINKSWGRVPASHLPPERWSAEHGRAARVNIVSCAGCHDQGAGSVCVQCHRVGGPGGNPHPAGYASQHKPSDIQSNAMCQVCHTR